MRRRGNYSCESITPHANEEVIYLSIRTKLFTPFQRFCMCVCVCVHVLSDHWMQQGGGDKPAQEKCVGKLNKLFTSFISHACSSLVNTFKSICQPLSHSSCSHLHFVSHLYFCAASLTADTSAFRHETRQNENIIEGSTRPQKAFNNNSEMNVWQ